MAKKKKSYDLSKENVEYTQDNIQYKVTRFNPSNMTVDVIKSEDAKKKELIEMPFAHLPKAVKKIIKPN